MLLLATISAGSPRIGQAQPAAPGKPLTVPNWTFDPAAPPSGGWAPRDGRPPFDQVTAESVPSGLTIGGEPVAYWLIQASGEPDSLDPLLDSLGAQPLGGHATDARLVRVAESVGPTLDGQPGVAAAVEYRPAYKAAPVLEDVVALSGLSDLIDGDGFLRLMAIFHLDEDPRDYEASIAMQLPPLATIDAALIPTGAGSTRDSRTLAVAVAPHADQLAQADATLRVLMGAEAIAAVRPWADAELPFERVITTHQVGAVPVAAPPWTFDENWAAGDDLDPDFAKLFARGITGRGELLGVTDRGFDSAFDEASNCRFTYGPNAGDQPPPLTTVVAPGLPAAGLGNLRPANKVFAALAPTPFASCEQVNPDHGWNSAFWAASEQPFVVAARAGVALDDPFDDEEASSRSEDFGHLVDAHQQGDAQAPGAQLLFQDFVAQREGDGSCLTQLWPWGDMVEQAYDAGRGVRVHNYSWGEFNGGSPEAHDSRTEPEAQQYAENPRTFDLAAWRRRDWLPLFSAGNRGARGTGTLLLEAHVKSGVTVGGVSGVTEDVDSSSRGPGYAGTAGVPLGGGLGGRIKPDVVATMSLLGASRASENCLGHDWLVAGTSSAAPLVSSQALGIRQYFVDGYYPAGSPASSPGFSPTNALLKAVLVNATRSLTGAGTGDLPADNGTHRPTHGQGWGRSVLDDSLFFAGDPIELGPGSTRRPERSFLAVLNDAPNGLDSSVLPNDGRDAIVDDYRGALAWPSAREHVYSIALDRSEDLHVTLAWSDPPPPSSYLGLGDLGGNPLRNDLDLELIDPNGTVWRPQPGLNTSDPARLWDDGFSMAGTAPCPAGCGTTCPPSPPPPELPSLEMDHPQVLGAECDFTGRDRVNTVENVFLEALPGGGVEGWQLRVLFYGHEDSALTDQPAWPNLNDTDGDLGQDFISDTVQGYALIASGNLATSAGVPYFGASRYRCGEELEVFLREADTLPSAPTVLVQSVTSTGATDCEELTLEQPMGPDFLWRSPAGALTVVDESVGVASACPGNGDGQLVATDDSFITVTYTDASPAGRVRTGTTRITCRNLQYLTSAFFPADGADPCQADTAAPDELRPGGSGYLNVTFVSDGGADATGLTATIVPENHLVSTPAGAVSLPDAPPDTTASFPIVVNPRVCADSPASVRFRVEVAGDAGFRDRSYFEVPLNCALAGTDTLAPARPDEVPDTLGAAPPSLRVAKAGALNLDLMLAWEGTATADSHAIWRGSLHALAAGGYDHAILDDGQASDMCGLPGGAGLMVQELLNEETDHPGSSYYLVTAVADCAGLFDIQGSSGSSRINQPPFGLQPFLERPHGRVEAPQCQ